MVMVRTTARGILTIIFGMLVMLNISSKYATVTREDKNPEFSSGTEAPGCVGSKPGILYSTEGEVLKKSVEHCRAGR